MLAFACSFAIGVALLETGPSLPDPMWCASLPVAVWLAMAKVRAGPLPAVVAGYAWAAFLAHVQMGGSLPAAVEGKDMEVVGVVRGLPLSDSRRTRFDFDVEGSADGSMAAGARVTLSWYGAAAAPAPGSVWRLTVRLRRPRGWHNPGGSDYEGRLFANHVAATGYVKSGRRIGSASTLSPARVDALRADLARSIRSALDDYGSEGLVRALAIGDRSGVSQQRWRTLRVTGIAHLMAISGLHIGMAAGAAYWVVLRAWTVVPRAALVVAAPQVAGVAALLAAFAYALLAGFALPTQRALLMLAVVFGSRLSRRCILPSHALALALVAVLAIDPHSVRAPGFWLSFVAVAVIVAALATRPAVETRTFAGRLRTLGTVQIAVTVGLAPVTLSVFAEQSLVSPLVNALVIPLVGMIVVPVILLGLLAGAVLPSVGTALLTIAAVVLDALWPALDWIGTHAAVLRAPGAIGPWQLAAAALGVLILLAPRGLASRWLGIVWLLPLIAMRPVPAIGPGSYRMTVLDVGHGLSVVVETEKRVLVYDTGPRVGSHLDAAALAVLPFLASRGHGTIDRVVLSHGDADHIGGVPAPGRVGRHRVDDRERPGGLPSTRLRVRRGASLGVGRGLVRGPVPVRRAFRLRQRALVRDPDRRLRRQCPPDRRPRARRREDARGSRPPSAVRGCPGRTASRQRHVVDTGISRCRVAVDRAVQLRRARAAPSPRSPCPGAVRRRGRRNLRDVAVRSRRRGFPRTPGSARHRTRA